MAKEYVEFGGLPASLYVQVPVYARGTVATHFSEGSRHSLAWHTKGVMVTFLAFGSTPEAKVLVPWGNVASVTIVPANLNA